MRSAMRALWLKPWGSCTIPWPRRMFLVRWLAAAKNTSRRRGVAVLLEEVVLHFPRVIDAEPVGKLDLRQRVLEELELGSLIPRAGELVLVENAELHLPHFPSARMPAGVRSCGRHYYADQKVVRYPSNLCIKTWRSQANATGFETRKTSLCEVALWPSLAERPLYPLQHNNPG